MATKAEIKEARIAARVAAAPNARVAQIMLIEDEEERWHALRDAGYCGYGAGGCRTDRGKVARRWKDEKGRLHPECKPHTVHASALNKDLRTPKAKWREDIKVVLKQAAKDPNWLRKPAVERKKK